MKQVLNLDPYNTAARKGQERIDLTKYQYGVQGYNETRGRAMWQVEHRFGTACPPVRAKYGADRERGCRDSSNTARIRNKLDSIIIPRIEFRDASIREAIDFLRQQGGRRTIRQRKGVAGFDIVLRLRSLGRSSEPTPVTATTTVAEPRRRQRHCQQGKRAPSRGGFVATAVPELHPRTPSLPPVNPG